MPQKTKKINIRYYALLREERGENAETITTQAQTLSELYGELREKYHFKLGMDVLRVAVNDGFCPWNKRLKDGDKVIFIPPVAGG
jgi:molybdopterin converting factor small subunit